jgi:uncharacterized protein
MVTAERLIAALGLQPLPLEGGYFRETYRSDRELNVAYLGPGYGGRRSAATAIYYLLTPESYSALHRLPGPEVFHFYLGDPVEMLQLDENGTGRIILLGQDVLGGQVVQTVVAGKVWQGSRLRLGGRFALLGTTMTPGFDFNDYEPGNAANLSVRYPAFADWIGSLTR